MGEEDSEFCDAVISRLNDCGALADIKARLRSEVIKTLVLEEKCKPQLSGLSNCDDDLSIDHDTCMAISITYNLLNELNLRRTADTLKSEIMSVLMMPVREKLYESLRAEDRISGPEEGPVLVQLLRKLCPTVDSSLTGEDCNAQSDSNEVKNLIEDN